MKKFICYFLPLLVASMILPIQLSAWDGSLCNFCQDPFIVTARVGYFHPVSKRVRKIYSDGWADYQLEIVKELYDNWQIWLNVSGFSKKGHSIGFHDDTRLSFMPVSLGVRYSFPLTCRLTTYAGLGACYSFLRIKDDACFVHRHTSKERFGGIAEFGFNYCLTQSFFANLFVNYLYQSFDFPHGQDDPYVERNDLNMSAFKVGIGIGAYF